MIGGILSGSGKHSHNNNQACGIKISFDAGDDLKFSTISTSHENVVHIRTTGTTLQMSRVKTTISDDNDIYDKSTNEISSTSPTRRQSVIGVEDYANQLHKLAMLKYNDNGNQEKKLANYMLEAEQPTHN